MCAVDDLKGIFSLWLGRQEIEILVDKDLDKMCVLPSRSTGNGLMFTCQAEQRTS